MGAHYTWMNKQLRPICNILDRMFISSKWQMLLPLASLLEYIRIGSDHVPLILSSGKGKQKMQPQVVL